MTERFREQDIFDLLNITVPTSPLSWAIIDLSCRCFLPLHYFLQSQKIKIEHKYFFVAIYCGLLFNFVMPPLGVRMKRLIFGSIWTFQYFAWKEVKQDNYVLLDEADKDSIIYLHDISSISEWYDSFEIKKATGNIKKLICSRQ